MALKLSQKKYEELHDNMTNHLTQLVRGMFGTQSTARRIYPNLKANEPDQPKQAPVDGWGDRGK